MSLSIDISTAILSVLAIIWAAGSNLQFKKMIREPLYDRVWEEERYGSGWYIKDDKGYGVVLMRYRHGVTPELDLKRKNEWLQENEWWVTELVRMATREEMCESITKLLVGLPDADKISERTTPMACWQRLMRHQSGTIANKLHKIMLVAEQLLECVKKWTKDKKCNCSTAEQLDKCIKCWALRVIKAAASGIESGVRVGNMADGSSVEHPRDWRGVRLGLIEAEDLVSYALTCTERLEDLAQMDAEGKTCVRGSGVMMETNTIEMLDGRTRRGLHVEIYGLNPKTHEARFNDTTAFKQLWETGKCAGVTVSWYTGTSTKFNGQRAEYNVKYGTRSALESEIRANLHNVRAVFNSLIKRDLSGCSCKTCHLEELVRILYAAVNDGIASLLYVEEILLKSQVCGTTHGLLGWRMNSVMATLQMLRDVVPENEGVEIDSSGELHNVAVTPRKELKVCSDGAVKLSTIKDAFEQAWKVYGSLAFGIYPEWTRQIGWRGTRRLVVGSRQMLNYIMQEISPAESSSTMISVGAS